VLARGQTILNTERFQDREVGGPHLSADLALSLKQGNAEIFDLSTAGMAGTLVGRHWPRVIFGGRYLSDEGSSILNDQVLQLRYSYLLSQESRTFHFVQAQKNETLLLQSRWLLGTGVRRTVVETDRASASVGTGLMAEWERLNQARLESTDDARERAIRITNLAVLSWTTRSGARVLNVLYVQPRVDNFGDVRILNDLGLSMPLTDALGATISVEWRSDTKPPAALSKYDLSLTAGLSVDFQ